MTNADDTSAYRARLDLLLTKAMNVVEAGPVQAFDLKGDPLVGTDGNPVMDYEPMLKALDQARKLSDTIHRLNR